MKKEFLQFIIANTLTEKDLDGLFQDLLTPKEYQDLIDRFFICQKLANGETVKKVSEDLKVAPATVVRGNRILKYDGKFLPKLLKLGVQ